MQGTRVQLDEAIGQVIVIREQEVNVCQLAADELWNLGGSVIDIHLDAIGAHHLAIPQVIQAYRYAVGAQSIAALGEVSMGDVAGFIRVERHAKRINARGFEPLLCPEGKVAAGGLF